MKSHISVIILLTALLSHSGCEIGNSTYDRENALPETHTFNSVKRISPAIENGADESMFLQNTYSVSADSHLLLRFEELDSYIGEIFISETDRVKAHLTLEANSDVAAAQGVLQLCPITRNWMMLSTWENAHPFGSQGCWDRDGGDYDEAGCVKSTSIENQTTLIFDVTDWFTNYIKGRNMNYGLIAISSAPVTLLGENSGSYSPRLLWKK